MLEFVNKQLAQSRGRVTDPSFISIARSVNKNHTRIRNRYLNSAHAVGPTHIVRKLLSALRLGNHLSGSELGYHTSGLVNQVAAALDLTSPVSPGKGVVDQIMQGGHTSVLLVSNRFDDTVPWTDLEPIVFNYHTNTNVNYKLGTDDDGSYGFVTINVHMLAHQLLAWGRWRTSTGADESVRQFISKYPLFNSLKSYMDISLLNRHYYRLNSTPIPQDAVNREFPTPNIEDQLDKSNLKIVSQLLTGGKTAGQTLYSTPSFFKEDALELFYRPQVVRTSAVRWWDYATLLPMIHYGLTVSNQSGYDVNQQVLSNLDREITAFINTRTLSKVPKHLSQHIMEKFIEPTQDLIQLLR